MSNCINSRDMHKLFDVKVRINTEKEMKYFSYAKEREHLKLITHPSQFDRKKPVFYFVFGIRKHDVSVNDAIDRFRGAFWYQPLRDRI